MGVLIDENGKVLTDENFINELLSPVLIGKFIISNEAHNLLADLSDDNANQLFQFIPKEMQDFCRNKNLIPTKASIFKENDQVSTQTRSEASQTPHINVGDELHFFFDGSYVIYFNIKNQHFSLIVQAGDWLFIPADVEHWIKGTGDHYLVIVSYHCEPFEIFHSKVKYTNTQSHAFL